MKSSGIGGQAVLEGIMMRHKNDIAVAVRKPDGDIAIGKQKTVTPKEKCKIFGWPVIRGMAAFISSMVIGIQTLTYSASFFMEEEDDKSKESKKNEKDSKKSEDAMMFGTVAVSIVLAVAIFMLLPYWAATGILKLAGSDSIVWLAVIEGVLKLAIFIAYISLISLMKDIKRTFMYHGSEHKCINCIESGKELTVDNVMASSKEHRRCGTSFLFFVLFLSIILFVALDIVLKLGFGFVGAGFLGKLERMGLRLLLIPIVAGLSFEVIQWAGNSNTKFADILSRPGMWIQGLTTKEPERDMVEVAICAVEAVFDWRAYLKEQGINIPEPEKKAAAAEETANEAPAEATEETTCEAPGEAAEETTCEAPAAPEEVGAEVAETVCDIPEADN